MQPHTKACAIAILMGLAACARTPPPQPTRATVEVASAPESQGVPTDWKQVATKHDLGRIGQIDSAWAMGLAEAQRRRHTAEIISEGPLLDPAAALARPAPPPGTYRCRIIKLGFGSGGRGRAFQTFKPFTCFVSVEDLLLVFIKATGSDLPAGRLWEDGDVWSFWAPRQPSWALPHRPIAPTRAATAAAWLSASAISAGGW